MHPHDGQLGASCPSYLGIEHERKLLYPVAVSALSVLCVCAQKLKSLFLSKVSDGFREEFFSFYGSFKHTVFPVPVAKCLPARKLSALFYQSLSIPFLRNINSSSFHAVLCASGERSMGHHHNHLGPLLKGPF